MDFLTLLNTCTLVISQPLVMGIVDVESKAKPYSININSKTLKVKSYALKTREEAIKHSRKLISAGYSIDMGLGQINSVNLPSLGLTVDQIFDPCTNLTALQTIFLRGYNLKHDKHLTPPQKEVAAISRYNTGHPTWGVKNGYVHKVLVAKMNLSGKPVTALSVTKTSPVMVKHSIPFEITHAGIPDGFSTAIAEGQ